MVRVVMTILSGTRLMILVVLMMRIGNLLPLDFEPKGSVRPRPNVIYSLTCSSSNSQESPRVLYWSGLVPPGPDRPRAGDLFHVDNSVSN